MNWIYTKEEKKSGKGKIQLFTQNYQAFKQKVNIFHDKY
jgi:predicted transcriptional regulator